MKMGCPLWADHKPKVCLYTSYKGAVPTLQYDFGRREYTRGRCGVMVNIQRFGRKGPGLIPSFTFNYLSIN